LKNLSQEIGGTINVDTIPGDIPTDEIIKMVVDKKINLTVADYNIAAINKTYYPILDINTRISLSQRIAWAVRKNSPLLLNEINQWIKKMKKEDVYYIIYSKYFKNKKSYRRRIDSEFYSKNTGKISKYDEIIRKYAAKINWDWRLISSMIYQESRFDSKVKSWVGAKGLMQMMPATAKEMGVVNIEHPEDNIKGGTKYLKTLMDKWQHIPDSTQRIKFALASYNCGYYHVVDAQKLTRKYGGNERIWDNQVAEFIVKLANKKYYMESIIDYGFVRGIEPYRYVDEIFKRYEHYRKFIPL
jgi:membrane-bound lytic murein transglycosylase F